MIDYSLYFVTDERFCEGKFEETIAAAIRGGVSIVQLREKDLETGAFYERARALGEITKASGIPLIINDRIDIALAVQADGVHLGQTDMPIGIARALLGPDSIIGVSVSTIEEAVVAERDGADYLGISPVFTTPTKTDISAPLGLDGIEQIRHRVNIPMVGIGGIKINNAENVLRAGCDGIAVVTAIMASDDPEKASRELRKIVDHIKFEKRG